MAPLRTRGPLPNFVRPKPEPESPIAPPTVKLLLPVEVVTVMLPPSVTAPVPVFNEPFNPLAVKFPFHDWGLLLRVVLPESSTPPLITSRLVPKAAAFPIWIVPEVSVVVPE